MNKKILLSLFLVLLVAISVSAISAENVDEVISADDASDVVAVDEESETLSADPIQPTANTTEAVQTAVSSATNPGDIVDLSKYSEYNFTNKTVTIDKEGIIVDGKGTTTIYGYGDGNGIFYITAHNVTIQGIKFVDENPKNKFKYNGTVAGYGVYGVAANGGVVKNCEFTNFNEAVSISQSKLFTVENNIFRGGYSTKLLNDPTVNKETGSKMVSFGGTDGVLIKNNTFDGPMLDGISVFQGSANIKVLDNTFKGNVYSIFFGGASTKGSIIKNNTFINCGFFKEAESNIFWEGFPVISAQKSSDNIAIEDNTFEAINNNVLVAGESANVAHGAPTSIENFNVTGNTVKAYSPDVNMSTVTLFRVLARGEPDSLQIKKSLNISENTLAEGVKGVVVCFGTYDNVIFTAQNAILNSTLDANHVYSGDTLYNTSITVSDVTFTEGDSANLIITLKDSNGVLLSKSILVLIDGNTIIGVTDNKGVCSISLANLTAGTKYATVVFVGEGNIYKGSTATAKITVNAKPAPAPAPVVAKKTTLTAKKATLKVKKAKKIKVTLKAEGKAVSGKTITIKVNKKTFKAKTNAKGVATISVKVAKKGKFNAKVSFAGDKNYKAVSKTIKLTVKK